MNFGTIPVRLFQPKAVSSKLRRGIIFCHGGGTICGSLGEYLLYWVGAECPHGSWSLVCIPMRTSWEGVKASRSWRVFSGGGGGGGWIEGLEIITVNGLKYP